MDLLLLIPAILFLCGIDCGKILAILAIIRVVFGLIVEILKVLKKNLKGE